MKKLITICLLMASTFAVNAQDMSFEETVKYINEKIQCCGQFPTTLVAKKDGSLTFYGNKRVNLFDLYDDEKSQYGKYGLYNILNKPSGNSYIGFYINKNNLEDLATFSNMKDAERVYNALLHLRSLCTKNKDPFDK